jgi:two-component system, cell cycle sensor histidine kinase and response regulator CckA
MKSPLHILHLEDDPNDAALIKSSLEAGGLVSVVNCVDNERDFVAALERGGIDVVFSDYSLPGFDGAAAIDIVHAGWPDLPVILISGTHGEEAAIDSIKGGATDYVLKEHLARLIPSVHRALQQVEERNALKHAKENLIRLAAIVESSDDAIIGKDMNGIISSWNKGAEKIFGYSASEMLGGTLKRLIPADRMDEDTSFLKRTTNVESIPQFETLRQTKGGKLLDVSVTISPIKDAGGKIIGTSKVARDITERKRIEARFRRLVDSNAQGVFFWNIAGTITDANDAFLKLIGYSRKDLKSGIIKWSAITPPEYESIDQRALQEVADIGFCAMYEKEFICKDGTRVPILVGAANFEDNPDEGVCFVLDLTAHKKLELQFRQSQKMEAVGQLASGVAHDFNNILAVIQIQADLLNSENTLSAEQHDFAREIGKAAQRAANLTRQLLLFGRQQAMQPRELDLSVTINNMMQILRRTLGENIEMQFKFAMQALYINADPGMIDQVLLNLAVNARDAMNSSGKLIIETSAVEFDETAPAQSPQIRPGKFISLSVSDTGSGIAPENLAKIFDPFFTTKEVGKGTGLGLATVFGIVQQHQGWINVYSEVGKGTTFRIYFPRLARISDQKFMTPVMEAGRGGNETILLVEDEPTLRQSVKTVLLRLGYRVLDAAKGMEALEIWKQKRDEIQLVLTDMVMPGGISGMQLGERLLKENPKLKIIYASGYSSEIVDKKFPLKEGVNFLVKPFEMRKLAKTVRDSLDNAPQDQTVGNTIK